MTPDSIPFILFGGAFLICAALWALARLLGVALTPPKLRVPSLDEQLARHYAITEQEREND